LEDQDANTPPAGSLGASGRYLLRRELGRGMMGVVYEAEDTALGRTVAVKTIELAFVAGPAVMVEFEERFFTEARVAAKLSHPGIVVCHDVGKDPATAKLFIVFEHLKGQTLAERVAQGPLAWSEAVTTVGRIARAIHHAHEHGVIHRDLKPANVMLLENGGIKIMDFGIAKVESARVRLTATGQSFGSPLYMSPEQALGQWSDARSDIFSLGSILSTSILGRAWFEESNITKILSRVVHDEAPRVSTLVPGVPAALDTVVARAMAKRLEERYPSAAAVADDLEDALAGRTLRHASRWKTPPRPAPRPGESGYDPLLADMTAPAGIDPGGVRTGTVNVLAALVDEGPSGTAPRKAAAPAAPRLLVPLLAVATALVLVALGAAAALLWPSDPAPAAVSQAVTPLAATAVPLATEAPTGDAVPTEPLPTEVPVATPAPTESLPTAAPTKPRTTPEPPRPVETEEPEVAMAAGDGSPAMPKGARVRLDVAHPLETGRLNAWIDGVLVFETKLNAAVSKKIVAIKIRAGHLETMLDVAPGRHEVRIEINWEDKRRVESKVIDAAPSATGLLEVKLSKVTKDLSLKWTSLAPPATP
jgi:eukaryotic-like serine/threonine-protein kinase